MKGIYLASFQANHPNHDIDYQDINGKRDLSDDMMDIDLTPYDYIIATPPCNYWSRANYRKNSEYSQMTKHLLPGILNKLLKINKPFIVENVRSMRMFLEAGLYDLPLYVYHVGRHTYWTNVPFNPSNVYQEYDFCYGGVQRKPKTNRQGGNNVHNVIEYWLQIIKDQN